MDGQTTWGLQGFGVQGFSGLSGTSTTYQGTAATMAAPATAASGGVEQGVTSLGVTCGICNSPTGRQGLFLVGIVVLLVGWHFHLYSMLE